MRVPESLLILVSLYDSTSYHVPKEKREVEALVVNQLHQPTFTGKFSMLFYVTFLLTDAKVYHAVVPLLCDHPSARLQWSHKGDGLLSGDIYAKMWDLAPDFDSLTTGGIAQQRGHMTGGPLYHNYVDDAHSSMY